MKTIFYIVLVLTVLILSSCNTTSSDTPRGYLTINNHSSATASVTVDNGATYHISAHGSKTLEINTGKSAPGTKSSTVSLDYIGDYILSGSDNITVYTDQTSTYDLYADCGILLVNNNSASTLNISFSNHQYNIDANDYDTYKFEPDSGSSGSVTYNYAGLYVFPNSLTTTVYVDETETVDIDPDGGAIKLINNSSLRIDNVYLSPSTDIFWGPDQLTGYLYPNENVSWTIDSGSWDIKVIDENDNSYILYDEYVSTNQTLSVSFSNKSKQWQRVDNKQTGNTYSNPKNRIKKSLALTAKL